MTTKTKEYVIKVPFTLHEWRKGQRYILAKYTTDEVTIINMKQRKEGDKIITESQKVLNLETRLPSIISKVLSSKSLLVDEFSINIDEIKYDNMKGKLVTKKDFAETEGLLKEMHIATEQEVKEGEGNELSSKNLVEGELRDVNFDLRGDEVNKNIKDVNDNSKDEDIKGSASSYMVSSSCETTYVNQYYDSTTFALTVRTMATKEYKENIFEQKGVTSSLIDYTDGKEQAIYVHKLVSVTINSMMLGWMCEHVKSTIKAMLLKFQKKLIETKDEWKDISEEELIALESDMIKTFMKVE